MRTRIEKAICSVNSLLVAASLLCVPTYNNAHAEAISKESIPLLERIGHESLANRERIRTWRGKVEFSQKVGTVGTESLQVIQKAMIRFVYDREKQQSLSVHEQTWTPDQEKGLELKSAMLTDDAYYLYDSYSPEHFPTKFRPYLMIYPAAEGEKSYLGRPGDFRPLDESVPRVNVSQGMLNYAKSLREISVDSKDYKYLSRTSSLSRTGNIVKQRTEDSGVLNEFVFDLNSASSLVEFVINSPNTSNVWKCKMVNVSGVFVPDIVTIDAVKDKERKVIEMKWFEQVVNEPISKDEFTIANMGVHQLDWVHDFRTGAQYELIDAKLPPRTTPGIAQELRQTGQRPSQVPRYLFLGNLFLLAVAVALIGYRAYRRAKARR